MGTEVLVYEAGLFTEAEWQSYLLAHQASERLRPAFYQLQRESAEWSKQLRHRFTGVACSSTSR